MSGENCFVAMDVKEYRLSESENVVFEVVNYSGSCLWIWIGIPGPSSSFSDLSLSVNGTDSSALLFQQIDPEQTGVNLARKLSKKIGKPVYLSYNIEKPDFLLAGNVEKRIFEIIKENYHH